MLILILIDVHYLQKVVFSFGIGSNSQKHSSSHNSHPIKKIPPVKFLIPPHPYLENLGHISVKIATSLKHSLFVITIPHSNATKERYFPR